MNKKDDFIVMIGRFEPFHKGHERNLLQALELGKQVIIILGSANRPRDWENPFTIKERIEYITRCVPVKQRGCVRFNAVPDTFYQNMRWVETVEKVVSDIVRDYYPGNSKDANVLVLGHEKDKSTTSYLRMLPWKVVDPGSYVKEKNGGQPLSATKIRELMFTNYLGYVESAVPPAMYDWLQQFVTTPEFSLLQEEYNADKAYLPDIHKRMESGEVATNFYTADAVVFHSGRVLLIRRNGIIGKGLWALPGGHVHADETSLVAALRELFEETNITLPEKILLGSWKGEKLFEHPNRSLRGRAAGKSTRSITVSHCFAITTEREAPRVVPGDDAGEAWWFTLAEIETMREQIFEDHGSIIDYWVPRVENSK